MKDWPFFLKEQGKRSSSEQRRRRECHALNIWSLFCIRVHACANESKHDREGEGEERKESFPMMILLVLAFWKQVYILPSPLWTLSYTRKIIIIKTTRRHKEVNQFIQIICKFRSQFNNGRIILGSQIHTNSALHRFLRAKKAREKWKSGTLILITCLC